jgi:secreted trypsin-like serine protease
VTRGRRPWLPLVFLLLAVGVLVPEAAQAQETAPPDGEVIGGQPADPGEYPFQVALLFHGVQDRWSAQFCGGTLISPDTVLTAGHCAVGMTANGLDILAGTNYLRPGGGIRARVRQIRVHPGYDEFPVLRNDVAILQLRQSLPYDLVEPVQPGEEALWTPSTMATTIGWGDRDIAPDHQDYPHHLREVQVPIVSDAQCASTYGAELVQDENVCAGDTVDGGEDSCYGDSGGPLMVQDGDRWVEVGIVSTGRGCARRNFPGIYTEVAHYTDFIGPYLDPDSAPDPVRRLRWSLVTRHSVRVEWSVPLFDGGTPITQYRIDVVDLGRSYATDGQQRHIRLRNLPFGEHEVAVRAVNALGTSAARSITVHTDVIID